MNKYALGLTVAAICLGGCATTSRVDPSYSGADYADPSAETASTSTSDEVGLLPPVPSFSSAEDCARAYPDAAGGCASADAVYISAGLPPPPGASSWFIPFAFGVMTNVLIEDYFAPPGPYIFGVRYGTFTSVAVINNYKHITRRTIDAYHRAPLRVQTQVSRWGPVRYSPSHGTVIGPARVVTTATSRGTSASPHYPSNAAPSRPTIQSTSAHSSSSTSAPTSPTRTGASTTTAPSNSAPRSNAPTSSYTVPRAVVSSSQSAPAYSAPARVAPSTYVSPPRQTTTVTAARSRSCVPTSASKCY